MSNVAAKGNSQPGLVGLLRSESGLIVVYAMNVRQNEFVGGVLVRGQLRSDHQHRLLLTRRNFGIADPALQHTLRLALSNRRLHHVSGIDLLRRERREHVGKVQVGQVDVFVAHTVGLQQGDGIHVRSNAWRGDGDRLSFEVRRRADLEVRADNEATPPRARQLLAGVSHDLQRHIAGDGVEQRRRRRRDASIKLVGRHQGQELRA